MQELQQSQIVERLDKVIAILERIEKQGQPIRTVDEAKARLGPVEYQRALQAKIEQTPLAEIFDATLEAQGKTVNDLFGAKVLPKANDNWQLKSKAQQPQATTS